VTWEGGRDGGGKEGRGKEERGDYLLEFLYLHVQPTIMMYIKQYKYEPPYNGLDQCFPKFCSRIPFDFEKQPAILTSSLK
jgi:hypothetical protein